MEGISHEACSLAGTLEARQADRVLRRQRHLDRRQGRGLVRRRHAASASRPTAGTCSTSTARTPRRWRRGHAQRADANRAALADLLQDHHRLGRTRTSRAPRRRTARRWARTKWPRRARQLHWTAPPFEFRPRCARPGITQRPAARPRRAGRQLFGRYRRALSGAGGRVRAAHARRAAGRAGARPRKAARRRCAGRHGAAGHPPVFAGRAERHGPALPELLGGSADLTGSNNTLRKDSRHASRRTMLPATTFITACASSA